MTRRILGFTWGGSPNLNNYFAPDDSNLHSTPISSVKAADIGKASGAFNMLRQLGTVFGVAIAAAVFAGAGSFHSAQTFSNGFAPAIGVCAALSLIGAIAALMLPSRHEKALSQTQAKTPETRESEAIHGGERGAGM